MSAHLPGWSGADILDSVAEGLERRIAQDDLAQSVRGIDSLDELGLHPVIREGLRAAGFGVWPEQRYPGGRTRRRRSEGDRCDIVLTPDGLPLVQPDAEATLFAPREALSLSDACWVEVKAVGQFTEAGANSSYASIFGRPLRDDVIKLQRDDLIRFAGVLLVLFSATKEIAEHDVLLWWQRMCESGYDTGYPLRRHLRLTNRLGNGVCVSILIPVRGL